MSSLSEWVTSTGQEFSLDLSAQVSILEDAGKSALMVILSTHYHYLYFFFFSPSPFSPFFSPFFFSRLGWEEIMICIARGGGCGTALHGTLCIPCRDYMVLDHL